MENNDLRKKGIKLSDPDRKVILDYSANSSKAGLKTATEITVLESQQSMYSIKCN